MFTFKLRFNLFVHYSKSLLDTLVSTVTLLISNLVRKLIPRLAGQIFLLILYQEANFLTWRLSLLTTHILVLSLVPAHSLRYLNSNDYHNQLHIFNSIQ